MEKNLDFVADLLAEQARRFVAFAASFQVGKVAETQSIMARSEAYGYEAHYDLETDTWSAISGNHEPTYPRWEDCLAGMFKDL